jgi:hypothetical protein
MIVQEVNSGKAGIIIVERDDGTMDEASGCPGIGETA